MTSPYHRPSGTPFAMQRARALDAPWTFPGLKEKNMKKLIMLLLAASFAVAGCNTMSGFGKDVEKAGDKIDDAATKRK
jgi:predicted small secreted protein